MIDELLVGLGFKYDKTEVDKFKNDIAKTNDFIKSLTKYALAAGAAISAMVVTSTKASDAQGKLAQEIGESVESISALQHAAELSGDSAEGMTNSLRNLSIRAAEAARGVGSGIEAFGLLGLSVSDSNGRIKQTSQLMLEVSDRFRTLEKSKQIELADKLGIRDSVRLLQAGPDGIRELTEEARALGVTTEEDAKIAAEFQDSLIKVWRVVKDMARLLVRELAPAMIETKEQFTDWWKANRDIISQNLPIWIDKITTAMKLLVIATGAWIGMRLISHVAALITMFKGLSIAALAANASALLLPILIGSAIAAIALLAEDAKTFFEGGDSFIGDMINKYPKWIDLITVVAMLFDGMNKTLSTMWDRAKSIIDLFKSPSFKSVIDFGKGSIKDLPIYKIGEYIYEKTPGAVEDMSNLNNGKGFISNAWDATRGGVSNLIEKIDITINGGNDSAEIIGKAVANELQQTYQNLSTTVDQ